MRFVSILFLAHTKVCYVCFAVCLACGFAAAFLWHSQVIKLHDTYKLQRNRSKKVSKSCLNKVYPICFVRGEDETPLHVQLVWKRSDETYISTSDLKVQLCEKRRKAKLPALLHLSVFAIRNKKVHNIPTSALAYPTFCRSLPSPNDHLRIPRYANAYAAATTNKNIQVSQSAFLALHQ